MLFDTGAFVCQFGYAARQPVSARTNLLIREGLFGFNDSRTLSNTIEVGNVISFVLDLGTLHTFALYKAL